MTFDEWKKLKRGDVLIWKDREIRLVQHGPADEVEQQESPAKNWVFFLKMSGTTYQPYTLYNYTEVGRECSGPYPRMRARMTFRLEKKRVRRLGYDLAKVARREAREIKRLHGLGCKFRCLPSAKDLLTLRKGTPVGATP